MYTRSEILRQSNNYLWHEKQRRLRKSGEDSFAYLGRHGQTELNAMNRYQGKCDSPTTEKGILQVKAVSKFLAQKKIEAVFASPLGRAQAAGKIIAEALGKTLVIIPEFSEMDFGDFEGRTKEEVQKEYKAFFEKRERNPLYKFFVPYPGGESYHDVYKRVTLATMKLLVENNNFFVVGHKGVNRVVRGVITNKTFAEMVNIDQKNNEVAEINLSRSTDRTITV